MGKKRTDGKYALCNYLADRNKWPDEKREKCYVKKDASAKKKKSKK